MSASPFIEFFYQLRACGVSATTSNWLSFLNALNQDMHGGTLDGFHRVARCILTNDESEWDAFDAAFVNSFSGAVIEDLNTMIEAMEAWVQDPAQLAGITDALRDQLRDVDLDELRKQLEQRLEEQKERHEGGSKWIGTGGRSPFGQGGQNPAGIRIGEGGQRSALAVASRRKYRELRRDLTLDTRQLMAALRGLRNMARVGRAEELDLEASVHETARMAGELEIVYRPPRANQLRVVLMMDIGGSMDPHAELVSRLFSAAQRGGGFRELRHYYFHNCVYGEVYEDAAFTRGRTVDSLTRELNPEWHLIIVGDAWMHPGELSMMSGDFWNPMRSKTGYQRLAQLAEALPRSAWLNPEADKVWHAPSIAAIRRLFPMYHSSVTGISAMASEIRRPPSTQRKSAIRSALEARSPWQ